MNNTVSVPVPARIPASAWYALAVLTLVNACHYLDRTMVSIMVEPIRHEFTLSDRQLGLLTGLAYGVSFALAGLPFGYLIDRVNRRRLLAMVVAIWSSMTALVGAAHSYWMLLVTRIFLGAAEAGGTPAAMAIISDLFPARLRSTALGIYLGSGIGAAASAVIGAFVAVKFGWRAAFIAAGLPGIALAVLVWTTLRDVPRGAAGGEADEVNETAATKEAPLRAPPILTVLGFLTRQGAVVSLIAAVAMVAGGMAAIGAWLPALLMRNHAMTLGMAGSVTAVAFGLFSTLGTLVGGLAADRLARRGPARRIWFCVAMSVVTIPAGAGAALATNMPLAVGLAFLAAFSGFAIFPSGFGSAMTLMPAQMRGMTTACSQVVSNLVGYGIGPYAVGFMSTAIGGDQSLRQGMAIVCAVAMLLATLALIVAARFYDAAITRAASFRGDLDPVNQIAAIDG